MSINRLASHAAPTARVADFVTSEVKSELLVYDRTQHHIHKLNATTAAIWRSCDGSRDLAAIGHAAGRELGVRLDDATVQLALTQLDDADLLAEPLESTVRLPGRERRTFTRRLMAAGALAVPAVVSITAPTVAQGHSTTSCDRECTSEVECGTSCGFCVSYTSLGGEHLGLCQDRCPTERCNAYQADAFAIVCGDTDPRCNTCRRVGADGQLADAKVSNSWREEAYCGPPVEEKFAATSRMAHAPTVTSTSGFAGEVTSVQVHEFAPGDTVTLELAAGARLGDTIVDSDGNGTITFTIPRVEEAGHDFLVYSSSGDQASGILGVMHRAEEPRGVAIEEVPEPAPTEVSADRDQVPDHQVDPAHDPEPEPEPTGDAAPDDEE